MATAVLLPCRVPPQREHQQLLGRKAERDKQAAALAKRVEAQQEQLAAAERLATEQAGEATGFEVLWKGRMRPERSRPTSVGPLRTSLCYRLCPSWLGCTLS